MSIRFVTAAGLASFCVAATAQAQVMPSPEDVAGIWDRKFERGPCDFASSESDYAIYSLQEAYERAGRCDEYGQTFDRDGQKIVWINYLVETPKPHSFQGFFAHYGLGWWDGYVPRRIKGTKYDSGQPSAIADTGAEFGSSARAAAACGFPATDDLSGPLQGFLSANDMCSIYDADRYDQFTREVSGDKRYAVNYVAWVAGEPMLDGSQAAALDAQYLEAAPANSTPSSQFTPPPQRSSPNSSSNANGGACGFPVHVPEQAKGQDILAKMGRCDEYQGPKE